MKIYELIIYLDGDVVHSAEIAAQNNHDALDTMLFVLEHHAKCDSMEFDSVDLYDITKQTSFYYGEQIAFMLITNNDLLH